MAHGLHQRFGVVDRKFEMFGRERVDQRGCFFGDVIYDDNNTVIIPALLGGFAGLKLG